MAKSDIHNQSKAKIILPISNQEIELPIIHGNEGPSVIDIRELYAKTGLFTYDPGFMSTASCKSAITFIDGDKGILRHGGYDIVDLANNTKFTDVAYLLLYGELPKLSESEKFANDIKKNAMVHEQLHFLYRGFPRYSHPMAVMVGAVASLSAFYNEYLDIRDQTQREISAIRLIAKIPTLAAMAHKYSIGQPFVYPSSELDYSENFLRMMFAVPTEDYQINPIMADALNKLLILHADHEQNASTSTVRLSGSSGANPFTVIGAGIASLWGPAHGGANEAVIKMLEEIGHSSRIQIYINKAKDKDDPFRLMGFGHRVYKSYDPRAVVLKTSCYQLLKELQIKDDHLLEIALKLEEIALNDPYFIERKLYPNVDFYSGIIYRMLGIPTQMFTVMFAVARATGWMAQWKEMMDDPEQKIGRPRQLYVGKPQRSLKHK